MTDSENKKIEALTTKDQIFQKKGLEFYKKTISELYKGGKNPEQEYLKFRSMRKMTAAEDYAAVLFTKTGDGYYQQLEKGDWQKLRQRETEQWKTTKVNEEEAIPPFGEKNNRKTFFHLNRIFQRNRSSNIDASLDLPTTNPHSGTIDESTTLDEVYLRISGDMANVEKTEQILASYKQNNDQLYRATKDERYQKSNNEAEETKKRIFTGIGKHTNDWHKDFDSLKRGNDNLAMKMDNYADLHDIASKTNKKFGDKSADQAQYLIAYACDLFDSYNKYGDGKATKPWKKDWRTLITEVSRSDVSDTLKAIITKQREKPGGDNEIY